MRMLLLAAVAATGLLAINSHIASAAPATALIGQAAPDHGMVTNVQYWWHSHHWHHRRWDHGHWRYWD